MIKLKKPSHSILKIFDDASVCPQDALLSADLPCKPAFKLRRPSHEVALLANRGATFHQGTQTEQRGKVADDLKESLSVRWRLKSSVVKILRSVSSGERSYAVCGCGHAANFKDDNLLQTVSSIKIFRHEKFKGAKPTVSIKGTFRCDSPWLCPSCAPARAMKRYEALKDVMERTDALGGTSAFVTLTVSHKLGMSLEHVKNMLSTASRKARQGKGWKDIQTMAQVLGVVQGVEVLHNKRTGWHYHAHLLVPCLGSADEVQKAMQMLVARYMLEVEKLGGVARTIGQDIQIVKDTDADGDRVSQYASKGSASWEIAGGLKSARQRESRTPWDLVQLANAGDEEAKALFLEYADNIVGTRSCVISASLAKKLKIEKKAEDAEERVQSNETASETSSDDVNLTDDDPIPVVEVATEHWRKMLSYGVAWKVINSVEAGENTIAVEAVVDGLIYDIECCEAKERYEYNRRKEERRNVKLNVTDLARAIVTKRQHGYSWERAKADAIHDAKQFYKMFGKNIVMPDEADLGRAVSREIENLW